MPVSDELKRRLMDRAASLQARGNAALDQADPRLRRALTGTQVKFRSEQGPVSAVAGLKNSGGSVLAGVVPGSPDTINVVDEGAFKKSPTQLATHESIHLWQNNLPPAIQAKIPADNPNDPYNFGGLAGLRAHRAAGGTLATLPREQASAMGQWYDAQGGKDKAPKEVRDVIEPYMNDMNDTALSTVDPTAPDAKEINTHPRAPMLPSTDVPGMLPAKEVYKRGDPAPGEKSAKKPLDLSAGMKRKDSYQGKGQVVGFDESTHLPIVRPHAVKPGEEKPSPDSTSSTSVDVKKAEPVTAAEPDKKAAPEPKAAPSEEKPKKPGSFGAMLAKGQVVHLANGTRGTIQHVSPSMRIARIKAQDGKNLTVRHSQIVGVEDKQRGNKPRETAGLA